MSHQKFEDAIRGSGQADDSSRENVRLMGLYSNIYKLQLEIGNGVLKPHELNNLSFRALMAVHAAGDTPMTPSRLSVMCDDSPANITRATAQLVSSGLIARTPDENDRRVLMLSITPEGREFARTLAPEVWNRLAPAFEVFTAEEKKTLAALLQKQLQALKDIRQPG